MRKKPTRKRPYFTMESAMTAILRDGSGKMYHGILFDRRLVWAPYKNSSLKFRKSGCTDPTQATARFVIVASQHTHNYALKVKSKYCLYPKEHSTVEKGRWKTKGGGILFRVESLWMQVKVKNSCELKRYVSQNIRTIRSNSWNCTVNKFGVLASLYSDRLCCIHFSLIDKLL